jgi:hypothetical protein
MKEIIHRQSKPYRKGPRKVTYCGIVVDKDKATSNWDKVNCKNCIRIAKAYGGPAKLGTKG